MARMKFESQITCILFLVMSCSDNKSMTTATSISAATMSVTEDPPTGTNGAETESDTNLATSATMDPTTTTGNAGPLFLSFKANVAKITEGETVSFTAVLTDPDGLSDILGGSLLSEDEVIDYGPFIPMGQGGTYVISLSWSQIHQAAAIEFENTEPSRLFVARFFDQGGHQATEGTSIAFTCAAGSACGGICADLSADGTNCGSCGRLCDSMKCQGGQCAPSWSGCVTKVDGFNTCAEACENGGTKCVENGCLGNTIKLYSSLRDCTTEQGSSFFAEPCDKIQDWLKPAIKCCCTDSN